MANGAPPHSTDCPTAPGDGTSLPAGADEPPGAMGSAGIDGEPAPQSGVEPVASVSTAGPHGSLGADDPGADPIAAVVVHGIGPEWSPSNREVLDYLIERPGAGPVRASGGLAVILVLVTAGLTMVLMALLVVFLVRAA